MYRTLLICLATAFVLLAILTVNRTFGDPPPEVMEVTVRFDRTALKAADSGGRDFLMLRQPRCVYPDDPVGAPVVPARSVRVVVPRAAKFQKVAVADCRTEKLAGRLLSRPGRSSSCAPECSGGSGFSSSG